jgi:hypothetical protein
VEQVLDVRIVWCEEWYDGPLTGVADHDGGQYWFTPLAEDWHRERPRRYVLRRLPAAEASALGERMSDARAMPPGEYWAKYHTEDRDEGGYQQHDGEAVGWFIGE